MLMGGRRGRPCRPYPKKPLSYVCFPRYYREKSDMILSMISAGYSLL